jgi:hypothetical protein
MFRQTARLCGSMAVPQVVVATRADSLVILPATVLPQMLRLLFAAQVLRVAATAEVDIEVAL